MDELRIGDRVHYNGLIGRVTATSGTDNQCIVTSTTLGAPSGWVPMAKVTKLPPEEAVEE